MKDTINFCNQDCEYLNPNEYLQNQFKKDTGYTMMHKCTLYKKYLKHYHYHPKIVKLSECIANEALPGFYKEDK